MLDVREASWLFAELRRLQEAPNALSKTIFKHVSLLEVDACEEDDTSSLVSELMRRSRSRSRSPRNGGGKKTSLNDIEAMQPDDCQVIEVESQKEKQAAFDLHLSKNTFHEERQLVELRIFRGDVCNCRTWILVPDPRGCEQGDQTASTSSNGRGRGRAKAKGGKTAKNLPVCCLAAVTVRVNRYENRIGRWAQILNMSTCRERQGFGTVLIAGLEGLLRSEDIDVVVLYPAENGRAPAFWSSLGFGMRAESHLPDEELIPHDQGGPLLPEFDPGSHAPLPRWEKRLLPGSRYETTKQTASNGSQRGRGRVLGRLTDYRTMPPSASRMCGQKLKDVAEALRQQRAALKATLLAGPPVGPSVPDAARLGSLIAAAAS